MKRSSHSLVRYECVQWHTNVHVFRAFQSVMTKRNNFLLICYSGVQRMWPLVTFVTIRVESKVSGKWQKRCTQKGFWCPELSVRDSLKFSSKWLKMYFFHPLLKISRKIFNIPPDNIGHFVTIGASKNVARNRCRRIKITLSFTPCLFVPIV